MSRPDKLHDALERHLRERPPTRGRVQRVEVRHENDCPFWDGHPCDCNPEVRTPPEPTPWR